VDSTKPELFVPAKVYSKLEEGVLQLANSNCKAIIMTCNTIHFFHQKLQSNTNLKIFSLVDLAVQKILQSKHKNVAIVSSEFTYKSGLYSTAIEKLGLNPIKVTPTQQEILNKVILKVMAASHTNVELFALLEIIQDLKSKGATSLILGCTELPLVLTLEHHAKTNLEVFDTIQIASEALVDFAYSNSEFNPTKNA
jgi:aspartate racemase